MQIETTALVALGAAVAAVSLAESALLLLLLLLRPRPIAAALFGVAASRTTRSHAHRLAVLHALGLQARDRKALLRWVVAWPLLLVLATALPLGMLLGHRWWEHEATILGLQRRVTVAWSLDALAIAVPLLVAVVIAVMLEHRRSAFDALRAE